MALENHFSPLRRIRRWFFLKISVTLASFANRYFSNTEIHSTLQEHYKLKVTDVMFRYQVSKNMRLYSDPSYACSGVDSRKIGYGA